MRVRGGIAVVKTLSLLLLSSQSAAVWAQSPSPQLAPVVLRPMDGKNAPVLPSVNEVAAKTETTQASLTSAGIPLQPMIPTSSPSSPSLPVGPIYKMKPVRCQPCLPKLGDLVWRCSPSVVTTSRQPSRIWPMCLLPFYP